MSSSSLRLLRACYHTGAGNAVRKPTVASVETHTMGPSLFEYLRMKGEHPKDPSAVRISSIEKKNKPFNWQRPRASVIGPKTLQLHCFPGVDYVQHYATVIATYLSLTSGQQDTVRYALPSQQECLEPLLGSNLAGMGAVDVIVVGYVHALERWTRGPWEGSSSNELFSWKKTTSRRGYRIAFLGCRVSFWGDVAGNMVRALQRLNGVRCVLYVGKVESLRAEHVPNHWLATGCQSVVGNELVTWANLLEPQLKKSPSVAYGVHCTLGSVLDETKDWLLAAEKQHDFFDPEIVYMVKASLEGGTEFRYLHMISDNLARKYMHDLSNERLTDVLQNKKRLLSEIQDILGGFFDKWSPK